MSDRNSGNTVLYALSTCPWCKKTKELLSYLGVEYNSIDVDLLDADEKREVLETLAKWNPARSFPTLVLNDEKCIIGFKENEIREALKR